MDSGVDFRGREWVRNEAKMDPDKDLTGQQFEDLTVLFRVQNDKSGNSHWLCKCQCGNEVVVKGVSLRSHHSRSCGCYQSRKVSERLRHDISPGTQFTYWTVIDRADVPIGRGSFWNVRCKCGTEKVMSANSLKNGSFTSCGCRHKELNSQLFMVDIVGERRGMLTITRGPVGKQGVELLWEARCDCGNIAVVSGHSFKRGLTTSCGCMRRSTGEILIASILDEANIQYEQEYSFDDLLGDANRKLRYDFAILNGEGQVTRLLEFDGAQHYQPVSIFGGETTFDKLRQNEYAKNHNIPLVRIPYSKQSTLCLDDLCGEEFLVA